jgi:hypothetical protein
MKIEHIDLLRIVENTAVPLTDAIRARMPYLESLGLVRDDLMAGYALTLAGRRALKTELDARAYTDYALAFEANGWTVEERDARRAVMLMRLG